MIVTGLEIIKLPKFQSFFSIPRVINMYLNSRTRKKSFEQWKFGNNKKLIIALTTGFQEFIPFFFCQHPEHHTNPSFILPVNHISMSLRPYLTSSQARKKQVRSSYHKFNNQNRSNELSSAKQKPKMYSNQNVQQPKSRPSSMITEYKINLLSKEFLGKEKGPVISATHFFLYDEENNVYVGQREDQQREVASLTKIMTSLVALELIERYHLDKGLIVRVSKNSAGLNGTSAKLPEGAYVKLQDLLYGTMLPSGNDAAYLLAQVFGLLLFYQNIKPQQKQYNDIESIDLSYYENTVTFVNKYIKEMNKKAKELKMFKSNFANPHGLGNVLNVSTAKDLMILCRYAVANEEFRKIMSTKQYECELYEQDMQSIGSRVWKNTNKLIDMGWQGIKTGHTPSAGCCLAGLKNGIYTVVLNSSTIESRFDDTVEIYRWYQTKGVLAVKKDKESQTEISLKELPVQ